MKNYNQEQMDLIHKLEQTVSASDCIVRFKDKLDRYIKHIDNEWLDVYVDHSKEVGSIVTWLVSNTRPDYDEGDIIYQIHEI